MVAQLRPAAQHLILGVGTPPLQQDWQSFITDAKVAAIQGRQQHRHGRFIAARGQHAQGVFEIVIVGLHETGGRESLASVLTFY